MPHFKYFQPIPGHVLCISAEDFAHLIKVYNKDFHNTPLYSFKVFSVTIIESLGQDIVNVHRHRRFAPGSHGGGRFTPRIYLFNYMNPGYFTLAATDLKL